MLQISIILNTTKMVPGEKNINKTKNDQENEAWRTGIFLKFSPFILRLCKMDYYLIGLPAELTSSGQIIE